MPSKELKKVEKTAKKRRVIENRDKSTSLIPSVKKGTISCSRPTTDYARLINTDSILADPYVYTCIKVLSESIASTPLEVYNNITKQKAKDFYLYKLLKRSANEAQTPYEVFQWLLIDYFRYNYCIAAVPRDEKDRVIGIYPLPADKVSIITDEDSEQFYVYGDFIFESKEILKVVNFFDRGLVGSSLVDLQKNTLGNSAATSAFAAESFAKGTFPSGIAITADETSLEELKELKDRFKEEFGGLSNAGSVILSSALKDYKPFTISNEDAQMLDTQKFNRSVIAGLFRVPAHLINDLEKATFSNVEHLDLSYVKHTLRPIAKNFEQRLNLMLLNDEEAELYNISYNFDAMLRGDLASRTTALTAQIQSGIRDVNEVRELENLPPKEGGDKLRINAALKEA